MKIDHCLFGYDDGHRLLSSSVRLHDDASSELTHLSDLAPGVRFGSSDGYWTGLPIPRLQRYALMKTWPAPEMPRPGCVWTHALLIDPILFEQIDELERLQSVLRRPNSPKDREFYASSLDADVAMLRSKVVPYSSFLGVRKVLESLYGSKNGIVLATEPAQFDVEIFAVWSQQWPKLRRNFRFQTALSFDPDSIQASFDIKLRFSDALDEPVVSNGEGRWLDTAAADIDDPKRSLRNFLWRYGSDVKRQRGSFRPLCDVYILNKESSDRSLDSRFLRSIHSAFFDVQDGRLLKEDIVDGRLFAGHQIEVLRCLLTENLSESFPTLSNEGSGRLKALWSESSSAMLSLAEVAVLDNAGLAHVITDAVAEAIPVEQFWSTTANYQNLRLHMIRSRPTLLDSPFVGTLSISELHQILEALPFDDSIGKALVRNLLPSADLQTARAILGRFPTAATEQVIASTNELGWHRVEHPWWIALTSELKLILNVDMMSKIQRYSTLHRLAEQLGWVSPTVARFGLEPWGVASREATNDLDDDDDVVFRSFLFSLALEKGGSYAPEIFEKCFTPIHSRILRSYLPWRAADILRWRLPSVSWTRSWDIGLRLRLAVVQAYISNGLDPSKFARLSSDREVQRLLKAAAEETDGGAPYARAIGL